MRIMVDEEIAGAAASIAEIGDVQTFPGRRLRREDLREAEALIVRSVTPVNGALLDDTPVRFVGTATSGVDHVDVPYLREQGIAFADAAGCNARPVAEYVLAALLHLAGRSGVRLSTRTIGVVGVGRVGSIVADWCGALGMSVLLCDPPLEAAQGGAFDDCATSGDAVEKGPGALSPFVSLDELAERADIVTFHVPLTDGPHATRDMVSARMLQRLRRGVWIVNTSRGEIADEASLIGAIDSGDIGSIVLDVWRDEPQINPDLMRRLCIATPHMAGYSVEARIRAAAAMVAALSAWRRGEVIDDDRRDGTTSRISYGETQHLILQDKDLRELRDHVRLLTDLVDLDRRLRAAFASSSSGGFDRLRQECRARREFNSCEVQGGKLSAALGDFMRLVGFCVA